MKLLYLIFLVSSHGLANEAVEALGEKIFNDIRFSKYFYQASAGDPNFPVNNIPEPQNLISCSSCHMIDQKFEEFGMRGYSDLNATTPLAIVVSGQTHSLRNTPALIGIGSRFSRHDISHYDGELVHSETYLGNFLGPHNGWNKNEKEISRNNIIKVLKEDRGDLFNAEFSYRTISLGIDPSLPDEIRLPEDWRVDIDTLSSAEIIDYMVRAGTEYLMGIDFQTDQEGNYIGSPYDQFLKANSIERGPIEGEDNFDYTVKLRNALINIKSPIFIEKKFFKTQKKVIGFEAKELKGLKTFFNIGSTAESGRGMCIKCHTAPLFTDQSFHNVAVTQKAFDVKNGTGAFVSLNVPNLKEREQQNIYFLEGRDLGVWNFFARDGKETLTKFIRSEFCRPDEDCSDDYLLPFMVARFKTPSLRNLGMSNPYFHDGSSQTIKETLVHYKDFSQKVRQKKVKNPAPQMRMMKITDEDIENLKAFLESLNENYE
jgi:cytochrome c peroxidase